MVIKTGSIVSHSGAQEWGVGKVTEVSVNSATIQFSDGKSRKIATSHYMTLLPANVASYIPPVAVISAEASRPATKSPRKKKTTTPRI